MCNATPVAEKITRTAQSGWAPSDDLKCKKMLRMDHFQQYAGRTRKHPSTERKEGEFYPNDKAGTKETAERFRAHLRDQQPFHWNSLFAEDAKLCENGSIVDPISFITRLASGDYVPTGPIVSGNWEHYVEIAREFVI
ncbi:uncharacterized protein MELLADRAFT_106865 [Melampsora larici-populina 98AG31]|uniref:Uncharacterized protein n=1 Tax=Melampsora larici-populina (strain 98AG31 / pathotype 3-4-7) TaxID=747676 RepID=F4RMX0_MELLP|nr:uncharacterized protein MELLADRAFT_106865 [Melampsora larici-populina 98AG31]EGG06188.1 hypothetical protein MELLADRAFT_106865 [Melampsora larici-populina 98AG31]